MNFQPNRESIKSTLVQMFMTIYHKVRKQFRDFFLLIKMFRPFQILLYFINMRDFIKTPPIQDILANAYIINKIFFLPLFFRSPIQDILANAYIINKIFVLPLFFRSTFKNL